MKYRKKNVGKIGDLVLFIYLIHNNWIFSFIYLFNPYFPKMWKKINPFFAINFIFLKLGTIFLKKNVILIMILRL